MTDSARPILFSGEMVRAILEGRKTQTRRVVKPQPDKGCDEFERGMVNEAWQAGEIPITCPYGKPGDRLWVREAFQPLFADGVKFRDADWQTGKGYAIRYVATEGRTEWLDPDDSITDRCKPGIHMPRWASRITLEVTGVSVQRVCEINHRDIAAEGVGFYSSESSTPFSYGQHKKEFEILWDKINAKRGFDWEVNPWVWVIEFDSEAK